MQKKQLSTEEFTLLAIKKLKRKGAEGIHAVFSGFNEAFRQYFSGRDPVKEMKKLAAKGVITISPRRGGVLISANKGGGNGTVAEQALKKMGL